MKTLVVQIILRQWDKSQISDLHRQARQALPDRYAIRKEALWLANNCVLDQHGDALSPQRLKYFINDKYLLIDRFRVDFETQAVEFKPTLTAGTSPSLSTAIKEGWIQCQYQWRYRVNEDGFVFWLYEKVILNFCFIEEMDPTVFINSTPDKTFEMQLPI